MILSVGIDEEPDHCAVVVNSGRAGGRRARDIDSSDGPVGLAKEAVEFGRLGGVDEANGVDAGDRAAIVELEWQGEDIGGTGGGVEARVVPLGCVRSRAADARRRCRPAIWPRLLMPTWAVIRPARLSSGLYFPLR